MISLKIEESKAFMNLLFKSTVFDYWEGRQIELHTYTHFKIDCKLNKQFYDSDELEKLQGQFYGCWDQLKGSVVSLIKGSKAPTLMKIVLSFPVERIKDLDVSNVDGLFINITLEGGQVIITTGTSLKTFTMDKQVENHWDGLIKSFFRKHNILVQ